MQKISTVLCAVMLVFTSFSTSKSKSNSATKIIYASASSTTVDSTVNKDKIAENIYTILKFSGSEALSQEVFHKAYLGFQNLQKAGKVEKDSHLLTIADLSLSSTKKRLWVIDLERKEILFNSLVAHGKNTGEEYAQHFSNTESSLQSSIGFYITEGTYTGSNGYSLKLVGMDAGYNDAALRRSIVMHGADYVSENFIQQQKRLGRSWGCPAVPRELAAPIINTIKGQNVLFIYFPDAGYEAHSKWLKVSA